MQVVPFVVFCLVNVGGFLVNGLSHLIQVAFLHFLFQLLILDKWLSIDGR